jgi:hypothetical protein
MTESHDQVQTNKGAQMPRVEVLTEVPGRDHEVMLTEHVPSEMIANEHYADQLVERLGWALVDAEQHEKQSPVDRIAGRLS